MRSPTVMRLSIMLRRMLASQALFCAGLAGALVVCRLAFFDYEHFLSLQHVPNHDMLAGAPYFASNIHSVRLTGEIAWWNPVSYRGHGQAQYYQSFFSPLAPTSGHIVFILCAQLAFGLQKLGVAIPEYPFYLSLTYIVLPFLTFAAFAAFAALLFRSRWPVVFVTVAYVLSGIGLWNSAWFYFQESCTLFFLLAAGLGYARRPTARRAALVGIALLIQVASLNYWTLYNSWFVAIATATHAGVYRQQWKRGFARAIAWMGRRPVIAGGSLAVVLIVAGLWFGLLLKSYSEQHGAYVRPGRRHTKDEVYARVQETRWFTVELFNPKLDRALDSYKIINALHNARYIGICALPLLLLLPFYAWGRLERWLTWCAVGVLCICMAPPFLLVAWDLIPGMSRLHHLFYFYSHYWQLLVVLLAGAALDRLLCGGMHRRDRRLAGVNLASVAVAAGVLLVLGLTSDEYPAYSSALDGVLRAAVLFLVASGILAQMQYAAPGRRAPFALALLALSFSDLSRYFMEASRRDHEFTRYQHPFRREVPFPLTPEIAAKLRQSWPTPDPQHGFLGGILGALPLTFDVWPDNWYLLPRPIAAVSEKPHVAKALVELAPEPVRFYTAAEFLAGDGWAVESARDKPQAFFDRLLLHDPPETFHTPDSAALHPPQSLAVEFQSWAYNDFTLQLTVPDNGWLLLHQLHDPLWRIRIDGSVVPVSRANLFRMAVPVRAGPHRVEMQYRPTLRKLYWPACWLLEGAIALLTCVMLADSYRSQTRFMRS